MKNSIHFYEKQSIEILYTDSCHSIPLHSHESFCVGIVESGSVLFKVGNHEQLLTKGMIYIIPSNVGVVITAKERYEYIAICIKDKAKEQLLKYRFHEYFLPYDSVENFQRMCEDFIESESQDTFLKKLTRIISPAIAGEKDGIEVTKSREVVLQAKQYIKDHANEKFNLDELAAAVYVSKYHLIRIFKEQVGVTPNQYHNQIRIFLAKKEIQSGKTETEVAMELNFSDQSYLCNLFKRYMGISLKDYCSNFEKL